MTFVGNATQLDALEESLVGWPWLTGLGTIMQVVERKACYPLGECEVQKRLERGSKEARKRLQNGNLLATYWQLIGDSYTQRT